MIEGSEGGSILSTNGSGFGGPKTSGSATLLSVLTSYRNISESGNLRTVGRKISRSVSFWCRLVRWSRTACPRVAAAVTATVQLAATTSAAEPTCRRRRRSGEMFFSWTVYKLIYVNMIVHWSDVRPAFDFFVPDFSSGVYFWFPVGRPLEFANFLDSTAGVPNVQLKAFPSSCVLVVGFNRFSSIYESDCSRAFYCCYGSVLFVMLFLLDLLKN